MCIGRQDDSIRPDGYQPSRTVSLTARGQCRWAPNCAGAHADLRQGPRGRANPGTKADILRVHHTFDAGVTRAQVGPEGYPRWELGPANMEGLERTTVQLPPSSNFKLLIRATLPHQCVAAPHLASARCQPEHL
eukprot:365937-Chlamydomonas_euryale.AAC.2